MAPPRKHTTDEILDAARAIVQRDGPRAASVKAIAAASGAPVGTLYHRFGSRDGLLVAVWLRALERFQRDRPGAAAAQTTNRSSAAWRWRGASLDVRASSSRRRAPAAGAAPRRSSRRRARSRSSQRLADG